MNQKSSPIKRGFLEEAFTKAAGAAPLDTKERQILEGIILGHTHKKIAQEMGIARASISHRFGRAYKAIMQHMGKIPLEQTPSQTRRMGKYIFSLEFKNAARAVPLDSQKREILKKATSGQSHTQIAQDMGINRSTVSSHFRKTCKIILQHMGKYPPEHSTTSKLRRADMTC